MDTKGHALEAGVELSTFKIESLLGVGGCGITYRAFDDRLERTVAIKEYFPSGRATRQDDSITISPLTEQDSEVYHFGLTKFIDEARALAKFQHPNIVRVNDLIEANGTAYIVMEFEEGDTLNRLIKRRGQLTERQALALCLHLLRGLGAIHAKDFLHRDVKPANVLVRRSGPPVLLDFSAARQALGERTDGLTVIVTPGYAPIEQYDSNADQGPWTDLYGLGATLFHALSGSAPAPATWRAAAAQNERPDPISPGLGFIRSFVTPEFSEAIEWMLQLRVRDRPLHAHILLRQLSTVAKALRGAAAAPAPPVAAAPAPPPPPAAVAAPAVVPQVVHEPAPPLAVIDPQLQRVAQDIMVQFVGPIAPLVVEREVAQASSPGQFAAALGNLLETDAEREALAEALHRYLGEHPRRLM